MPPARRLRFASVLLLPAALLGQQALAAHPALVERVFSRGVYPRLGGLLPCLTAAIPVSVAEVLAAGGLLWLLWRAVTWRRRAPPRLRDAVASGLVTAAAAAGAGYAAFLALWGLNYHRQPFSQIAGLDTRPAGIDELESACADLVESANRLRRGLPEDEHGVLRLPLGVPETLARTAEGFTEAARRYPALSGRCARPKPALLSPLLSFLGISGIYVPFTGEPHVNGSIPEVELPFSAAHEMAHQRGFAREDEANYLGYLACRLHPDPVFRYSGTLAAGLYALRALGSAAPPRARSVQDRLSAPVTRDVAAIAAWTERHRGLGFDVARTVNDAYLRSQGQREGVQSYGRMVDLLLAERRSGAP